MYSKKERVILRAKRGQVSIFLILGVVILLSALVIFFMQQEKSEQKPADQVSGTPQVQPIYSNVEDCIAEITEEGLTTLGQQGGYIYPEKWGYVAGGRDYEANAVRFAPGSSIVIPYWYHMQGNDCSEGGCSHTFQFPLLHATTGDEHDSSIEAQLERYVEDNVPACTGGFDIVEKTGLQVDPQSPPEANITITANELIVSVHWPIEATKVASQATEFVNDFQSSLPVRLPNIYHNAAHIAFSQRNKTYVENLILNLITTFGAKDSDKLPPTGGLGFDLAGGEMWVKTEVEEKLRDLITSHMQGMQYYQSLNYQNRSSDNQFSEYAFHNSMMVPSIDGAEELEADFLYLPQFWDFYMDLNCEGEVCEPDSFALFNIVSLGIQQYRFLYDISFPLLVRLEDPDGLDRPEGFTFQFFLESNIRNNKPFRGDQVNEMTLGGGGPQTNQSAMFNDPAQRNSGQYNITVVDPVHNTPIPEAAVTYSCGPADATLGTTNETGKLFTRLPICFGGRMRLSKEGFLTAWETISTSLDEGGERTIEMNPITEINFTLRRKMLTRGDVASGAADDPSEFDVLSTDSEPLAPSQKAVVQIEQRGVQQGRAHRALVRYDGNASKNYTVKLAAGDYKMDIIIIDERQYVIPPYEECGGDIIEECEDVEIDPINKTVMGGIVKNVTFSEEQIWDNNELTVYTVSPDLYGIPPGQRRAGTLELMGKRKNHSRTYATELYPEFH